MKRSFKFTKAKKICLIALLLIVATSSVALLIRTTKNRNKDLQPSISEANKYQEIFPKQTRMGSKEDLDKYKSSVSTKSYMEKDLPENIDWAKNDLLAIEHGIYVGRSFQSITLETIDGSLNILVTLKEAPSGCFYTQENKINILYVKVPKNSKYKVFQKILPNTLKCKFN